MAEPKTKSECELLNAVKKSDIIKVKELLKSNFSELKDERYFDYHLIVKALSKSQVDIAKSLIEKGFRVYNKSQADKTILGHAVRLEDIDLVRILLAKGAAPDILVLNSQQKTPFHTAVNKNQISIIELFFSQCELEDIDKRNILHYAVQQNKAGVVTKLIELGLSLKKKNENNFTPCCIAFNNNKFKILECLLSPYNVQNINLNDYNDIAPAYISVVIGNLQLIKKYVDLGLSINSPLKSDNGTWACLNNCSGLTLFQFAVKHIKVEIVEFLLSKGADILVQNKNRSSPLHIAFERKKKGIWKTWQEFENNNSIIDLILKANMKLKSNPENKYGLSHFHVACSRNEPTIVEHFLKVGALINHPVSSQCCIYKDFSPLHFAAKFRCKKTLELLLKHGADVKQTDFEGMTALHIGAKESCEDVVSLLLQYGAAITSMASHRNSPVHLAFKKQNYAIIDLLLSVDNVAHLNLADKDGLSHFHIACTRSNVDVVKKFIATGASVDTCVSVQLGKDKDTNKTDESGYCPLHFAVSYNRPKIVELLLNSGANVNMKDSKGFTPLHIACRFTNEMFRECIKITLCNFNKCGDVTLPNKPITDITNVYEQYFNGFSGSIRTRNFDWASNRTEYLEILNLLLKTEGSINCIDNDGNTPLYYVYIEDTERILKNNFPCSKLLWNQIVKDLSKELCERRELISYSLLKLDVNFDKCYKNGSILHYICSRKDKQADKILETILKKGVNVNIRNDEMLTPLHQATLTANKNLLCLLLNYGAHVDCINPKDQSTPLLIITSDTMYSSDCHKIIKIFIKNGANVNARQSDGSTALHNLASLDYGYDSDARICMLIKANANIHSRDLNGLTPLHVACLSQNYSAASALLKNGANINLEDDKGKTVCCYLYEKHLKDFSPQAIDPETLNIKKLLIVLQTYILKMTVIGLPVSERALLSYAKFEDFPSRTQGEKEQFIEKCNSEVQILKDKEINKHCTLYNMIFRSTNGLAQLVKNRTFKTIVRSKTFEQTYPNYGYLIQLKYQTGLDRADLLPTAKYLLNNLIGQHLPDACSEHICNYFTNFELKQSIQTLSSFLNCKQKMSKRDDNAKLKTGKTNKYRKIK